MVVPIYDDNPFGPPVKPVVTWALIAVNLLIYLYEMGASQLALDRMIDGLSLTPAALMGDVGTRTWVPAFVTLITYQFLHADIAHVLGNMIFLWVFGDDIERAVGRGRYLAFYLLCGVGGGLVFVANDPQSRIELIGASGAIAGVLGAYITLHPNVRVLTLLPIGFFAPLVRIPAIFFLGFWFLQQFLAGTMSLAVKTSSPHGGVAWWAHIGGFAAGAVLVRLMAPRRRGPVPVEPRWERY